MSRYKNQREGTAVVCRSRSLLVALTYYLGVILQTITLTDATSKTQDLPYGFVLWASGVSPVPLIKKMLDDVLPKGFPGPR